MTQPARAEQSLRSAVGRIAAQREAARTSAAGSARPTETGVERPDSDQEKQ